MKRRLYQRRRATRTWTPSATGSSPPTCRHIFPSIDAARRAVCLQVCRKPRAGGLWVVGRNARGLRLFSAGTLAQDPLHGGFRKITRSIIPSPRTISIWYGKRRGWGEYPTPRSKTTPVLRRIREFGFNSPFEECAIAKSPQ